MLTLEQYEALSEAEKAAVILKGNFLADREENGLMVQLYDVGRFYAEVSYDRAATRIIGFRVFEGTGRLILTWPISGLIHVDDLGAKLTDAAGVTRRSPICWRHKA